MSDAVRIYTSLVRKICQQFDNGIITRDELDIELIQLIDDLQQGRFN